MKKNHNQILCLFAALGIVFTFPLPNAAADEKVLDAVVASIDGKPITLQDLGERLSPPRKLTMKDAASDPEARAALDMLITETVMQAEAEARKMSVGEAEVETYINEVAARNNLSRPDFEKALAAQKKSLDTYKHQVKLEILKTKLTSVFLHGGVGVSEEEVNEYLKEHSDSAANSSKMTLQQLRIDTAGKSDEEVEKFTKEVAEKVKDGKDFSDIASKYKEGPMPVESSSLGTLSESELNHAIFDAVFPLKKGETSGAVQLPDGVHFFKVEDRIAASESAVDESAKAEARRILSERKLESKLQNLFTEELFKLHSVDKKI